jgi:serine/threonine-protein kinase HipA
MPSELSDQDAAQTIAQVWEKVRAWKLCFDACGVPGEQIERVESAFRHVDAISSAAMRRKLG